MKIVITKKSDNITIHVYNNKTFEKRENYNKSGKKTFYTFHV